MKIQLINVDDDEMIKITAGPKQSITITEDELFEIVRFGNRKSNIEQIENYLLESDFFVRNSLVSKEALKRPATLNAIAVRLVVNRAVSQTDDDIANAILEVLS